VKKNPRLNYQRDIEKFFCVFYHFKKFKTKNYVTGFFREQLLYTRFFSRATLKISVFFASNFYVTGFCLQLKIRNPLLFATKNKKPGFFRDHFLHGLKIFGTDFA